MTISDQKLKSERFQELIIEENKNLNDIINQKEQQLSQYEKDIHHFEQQQIDVEKQFNEVGLDLKEFGSLRQENVRLKQELKNAQAERAKHQQTVDDILESHKDQLDEQYDLRRKMAEECKNHMSKIQEMQTMINDYEAEMDDMNAQLTEKDNEIERLTRKLANITEIMNQRDEL